MPYSKATLKQDLFAREFVRLDNASAAYRIAYPSSKKWKNTTVNEQASRLLRNDKVNARIEHYRSQAAKIAEKKFNIDSTTLLNHLDILRRANISEYVEYVDKKVEVGKDKKGKPMMAMRKVLEFKTFDQLTEQQLMCIESIKEGRHGIELKLHGKDWTIEKIAKHIGFYEKDNEQRSNLVTETREERDKRIDELLKLRKNADR